ncbi:acyltransferase family protein [Crateriforma spongiae]|uniref:acyltransferase family protein n=1 Tax=Crateriforma spongiae TaxID=2724528 RepID=UPI001444C094|nr:acyltransferase family protein [Crateriforma spongiae]
MSKAAILSDPRRHDLDALRAVAMLLGIVLHGMISFLPVASGWAVQDSRQADGFGVILSMIHGFRMPLFFLISGFFTMMLLRRRGIPALLWHRFRRIFLPLVLGLFTIIPSVWIVSAFVQQPADANASADNLWAAVIMDQPDRIQALIDDGQDVNARSDDGATPFLLAAFLGRDDAAEVLIRNGADPTLANYKGETPADVMQAPWSLTKMIAGFVKAPVKQEAVQAGRQRIAQWIPEKSIDSATTAESADQAKEAAQALLAALFFVPVFLHLWFLWFLCFLVVGFVIGVWIYRRLPWALPTMWAASAFWVIVLVVPVTALLQASMKSNAGQFGPDTSIGLLPLPVVLAYYAVFFFFGALYYRADDTTGRLSRHWPAMLLVSLAVLFPVGLTWGGAGNQTHRIVGLLCQAGYAWLMSIGMMGLFRRYCHAHSPVMRYLSDSSYWLYVAHMPVILLVQAWVRDWDLSPYIKLPIICVVTSVVLLISYQYLVRYTPIGTLLNGKRVRPGRHRPTPDHTDAILIDTPPGTDTVVEAKIASSGPS